ncbi:MAG TPA: hypothetical protein P5228_06890 [Bacteroidales bacterium]|nr:hypothetical protein [Bacteroidales bacterium]HRZ49476.1 hypothetical protein [Bacteroidales bacterium]
MNTIKDLIFKILFPAVFVGLGLLVVIFGILNSQTIYFLLGGLGLILVGTITLLIMIGYNRLPLGLYKILMLALLPLTLVMFWLSFSSINEPIKFENEYKRRSELIKEKLIHIRDAQEAYKSVHKRYTGDFDTLINFINNGKLKLLRKVNNTPLLLRDSLPETELIRRGYIIIDTTYKNVKDSIFKNVYNFNPANLPYIPYSNPRTTFSMKADMINRSGIMVPVFEVVADKNIYLQGLKEEYIKQDKVISLQVGSLSEPIIDGNWE